MEPVLGGRDDLVERSVTGGRQKAAMEPVLGGRDDVTVYTAPVVPRAPQWSPSLADGTTA